MWSMWVLVGGIVIVLVLIIWVVVSATRHTRSPAADHVSTPKISPSPVTNSTATSADAYIRPIQPRAGLLEAANTNLPPRASTLKPAQAPLILSVRLTEDSWVEVVVDGRTLPYRIQKAGWEKEWPAQKSIVLRVGNAAGVKARLNGQDLGSLGRRSQKVERKFTR